jgi:hypothetical protein
MAPSRRGSIPIFAAIVCGLTLASSLIDMAPARAQGITRSGPNSSRAPIVNGTALDFIQIDSGASIDPAPDGAAIRNTPTGTISEGINIDSSAINGDLVNRGAIAGLDGLPAVSVSGSTISGRIANFSGINTSDSLSGAISITDSTITGGILNAGSVLNEGPHVFGGPDISISGGSLSGGLVNTGTLEGGVTIVGGTFAGGIVNFGTLEGGFRTLDVEADSFSGGIVNTGTIRSPVFFSPVPGFAISVGGTQVSGNVVNSGALTGGIEIHPGRLSGSLINAGIVGDGDGGDYVPLQAVALTGGPVTGSLINHSAADISGLNAVTVDASIGGTLTNAGIIRGITSGRFTEGLGLASSGIVVGPNASIAGGIVNNGTIAGAYDTETGQYVNGVFLSGSTTITRVDAINLTAANHPTRIAQRAGLIVGDIDMRNSVGDQLVASGGQITGNVLGDAHDQLTLSSGPPVASGAPTPGGPARSVTIAGDVTGVGAIAVPTGRAVMLGNISNVGALSIGNSTGPGGTLQLGAGDVANVGSLNIARNGTLATTVTADGSAGQLVAGTARIGGTLEIDVVPGNYAATTVYDGVVSAPGLGSTNATFKHVRTDTPGFKAKVTYDDGTADVTLTRVGAAARTAADPRPATTMAAADPNPATAKAATAKTATASARAPSQANAGPAGLGGDRGAMHAASATGGDRGARHGSDRSGSRGSEARGNRSGGDRSGAKSARG